MSHLCRLSSRCCTLLALLALALQARADDPNLTDRVQFNRDIRPFLSDTCFRCHGFDANARKADLRLDKPEGATADLGEGVHAIVPGKLDQSEAWRRVSSDDSDVKMPPPESGLKLTPKQVELFKKWIEQGAEYQPHWSLVKPQPTTAPVAKDKSLPAWSKNPIDQFILERLEREGLKPSPEADRITLIRRVTLDLTGLPPTPAEVDSFLSDDSADAYEKLVDRLLASPRYGERMATRWLDLARYADTNGLHEDGERSMWRWRDWVIDAFNNNMPFDQFTIEQLAGDLLPNPTWDQKIATGFNRNHRTTFEGGTIPDEARTEYVIDRVETTATTFLGLTMGCARCHDHKYDPITQKDFYQFFAFFNNVPEKGVDGMLGNSDPKMPAPMKADQIKLAALGEKIKSADTDRAAMEPKVATAQKDWEPKLAKEPPPEALGKGLLAHFTLDGNADDAVTKSLTGVTRNGDETYADAILIKSADFDAKRIIDLDDVASFERTDSFSLGAWVLAQPTTEGAILARQDEGAGVAGYTLYLATNGVVHFQLINKFPGNGLLISSAPIATGAWHHLFATYDGSGKAAGAKVYLDGKPLAMNVASDTLTGTIRTATPLQIAGRSQGGRFLGKIDDVRIYNRVLAPAEVAQLVASRNVARTILATPTTQPHTQEQNEFVRNAFLEDTPDKTLREPFDRYNALKGDEKKILDASPSVMVMVEMPTPRESHILKRGQYDLPGEKVTAAVPACLPPLPKDAPVNRLGLARWLVDPANPLVARVIVNRWWETYFGYGIVKKSEDFGTQSEPPSHPELLDWLALEFIKSGWNVKAMQRLMVTSSTYRQSSNVTPEMRERDPQNRLLAHAPRLRMGAEQIRDEALAASGLLVERLGGPSVKPYQPAGLWEELSNGAPYASTKYEQGKGEALYRRSLYTIWKRTAPSPTLTVFDAPSREVCAVNRTPTNTPLQALALLNDVTFVEASRKLAERIVAEGGVKPSERLTHAFRLTVARKPTEAELKILVDDFNAHLATYFSAPESAAKLLGNGESSKNISVDQRELAAYTAVASVILNMDESITRE